MSPSLSLGLDFGTSGARAIVINSARDIVAQTSLDFSAIHGRNLSQTWQDTLVHLLQSIPLKLRQQIGAIAINGTSSTVLLCNADGQPITDPLLYNDGRGAAVLDQVRALAPPHHTVLSATSSLAKLLWWLAHPPDGCPDRPYLLHQADWLAFLLHGQLGISDYHNALKLGYDVEQLCYPAWMQSLQGRGVHLPQVVAPGTAIAPLQPSICTTLGLSRDCIIFAGTTDSIAAFLASGAQQPGEAVTSLGSTLVLKLLSQTRVEDARYGIYSHRLGQNWLVGGASNTGGAVLRQFFSDAELEKLSAQIPVDQASPLQYYPLLKPGERFPIADPNLPPCLDPRPDRPVEFLHGLLDSMARIEARGYALLQEFGATPLTIVYTAGGGAKNEAWMTMRSRHLQLPVRRSVHTEAAYGTALLALQGQV